MRQTVLFVKKRQIVCFILGRYEINGVYKHNLFPAISICLMVIFMKPAFEYIFPAIRGIQAGREYYTSMCPLRLIPKIFLFDEEELVPELRAQRTMNKSRVPEMAHYMLNNPKDYVFSAITASVDGKVHFDAIGESPEENRIGALHIGMDARFIINDGQHRRAAIERALRENSDLADETIAVVLFLDIGLKRCQQMFADLNRYAIRPSKSLGVLYDHRDEMAILAKYVVMQTEIFQGLVEMEKSTLSPRARKLFTLSSIFFATKELLDSLALEPEKEMATAVSYWTEVSRYIPEWSQVKNKEMNSGEVRRDFIHSHGTALQALGKLGNYLIKNDPSHWHHKLKKLSKVDWSRNNLELWEGRAMTGGRVSKSSNNIVLTCNAIKNILGLKLSPVEQKAEDAFQREINAQ